MKRISEAPLTVEPLIAAVSHAGAGAVDVFYGIVRDFNDGRPVTLLEYHAYEAMAEAEIARIEAAVVEEFPGVRAAVQHRIGPLAVGEIAVLCVVSAVHRGEAFRACRALIDRVKGTVPIWKREHGPDGPYWVGWEDARCTGAHGHDHGDAPEDPH